MKKKLVVFLLVLTLLSAVALAELSPANGEEYKDSSRCLCLLQANARTTGHRLSKNIPPSWLFLYEGVQFSCSMICRGHEYSVED